MSPLRAMDICQKHFRITVIPSKILLFAFYPILEVNMYVQLESAAIFFSIVPLSKIGYWLGVIVGSFAWTYSSCE